MEAVQIAVKDFETACKVREPLVPSPYWRKGYNPNYPTGGVLDKPVTTIKTESKAKNVVVKAINRKALKLAKQQCVNKGKLTTIVKSCCI